MSGAQAACGGDAVCRTAVEECTAQSAQGTVASTCDSLCQDPTAGTCTDTTPGTCTNVNPGTQTCGLGACLRSSALCVNGAPNTCMPGTPTTETCNNIDDNCDGTIGNGNSSDGLESNGTCASYRTLPTVGSDQTLTQNRLIIYPSGGVGYFRINAVESDSSCACCDFFCTDEDYQLRVTLTVPAGAGSYLFCTNTDCAGMNTHCTEVLTGQSTPWCWNFDGACGATTDSYTLYVRVSPDNAPGFECLPYTLSYFFDADRCF